MENNSIETRVENGFDLLDCFYWVLKFKWGIIIIIILFTEIGFLYTVKTYEQSYTATASMVINIMDTAKKVDGYSGSTSADIHLAQDLVDTYLIIMKSNKVIEYVIKDLNLDIPITDIRSYIDLKQEKTTQVLNLTVKCDDAKLAVDIANSIMKVAPKAMMETVEIGSVNVLDEAKLPEKPDDSNIGRNSALSALFGLLMGIFIAIALALLTKKIKNAKDIEGNLSLSTLGEIPHVVHRKKAVLMTNRDVKESFVESIILLGTIVQHASNADTIKKILVTSSLEAEGKTTVAVNLSMALAEAGKSVLLMDCDFRKPKIYKMMNIPKGNTPDLADVITGKGDLNESIIEKEHGLSVIPCFGANKKYNELVSSPNLLRIINAMEEHYDFIIIDSPPAFAISDTVIISHIADGVLMVIRQEQAPLRIVMDTVSNLNKAGAKIMGCVLNDIRHFHVGTRYKEKYKYNYPKKEVPRNEKGRI